MARQRNYKAEYRQRITAGMGRGLSRQQARGRHPAEGVLMPDGRKHIRISAREIDQGFLRADTVEDLHRVNVGLRSRDKEKWLAFCRKMGWPVYKSERGNYYTQNDVPSDIIENMEHPERRYFFGY